MIWSALAYAWPFLLFLVYGTFVKHIPGTVWWTLLLLFIMNIPVEKGDRPFLWVLYRDFLDIHRENQRLRAIRKADRAWIDQYLR